MKNLNYLLMGLFVASAFTFTSCTDDGESVTADIYYSVNGGSKQVAGSEITEDLGSTIDLEAIFTMGTSKITKVSVKLNYDKEDYIVLDSTLNDGFFNAADKEFKFNYSTNVAKTVKTLTMKAVTKNDSITTFIIKIKPTATSIKTGTIKTSTAKILGAQSNVNGSLYSLYLDEVIKLNNGAQMISVIDLVYYYGSQNKATLGSPDATDTKSVYATTVGTWTNPNATKFIKLSGVNFDNITTEDLFDTAYGNATLDLNQMTNLQVGDIFAIKTTNNKAIIKVKAISKASTEGAITIDIKSVQ